MFTYAVILFPELYGSQISNCGEVELIPKMMQLAPDVTQCTQVGWFVIYKQCFVFLCVCLCVLLFVCAGTLHVHVHRLVWCVNMVVCTSFHLWNPNTTWKYQSRYPAISVQYDWEAFCLAWQQLQCWTVHATRLNSSIPAVLMGTIYFNSWPWLRITSSAENKTYWLHFVSHFSTEWDEIWCVDEAVQTEHLDGDF